ncbi:DNA gyrase subunit A [Amphiplicatus metriothermophilus]|uniref:DNA gyrase subunit A n=1 Tax=Amphiplicatus metriothermophilus TaxID=1519374 RepID=A0A239PU28_9PROT|nr:DNA gyrase subunit A [Amphiplicatus metriothermophilus]MBB5519446.1 DNA gyrase subunit A [Amphiplicatus metriothermophilus]SNT73638.1 DNA gyrase subunit A [Amphiplicatus metriothermophilus]
MAENDEDLPGGPADDGKHETPKNVSAIAIEDEMRRSYLDYAMSVIVSRAIPDARDGLKPVHRRILWAMHEMGLVWNKSYRKAAGVVGETMGNYHPHGDQAIYDALVRMAQDFSMRLPLIDGQGNFGSIDGDPPAAMRYTECRMAKAAEALLADIEKDTVRFEPNYDGRKKEPTVLPARFPNLLVNGAGGIAVGMATNIPPHNLGEVVDATVAMIDNPDITDNELVEIVPGPDFPTGGLILGRSGAKAALLLGRGSVMMRGRAVIEETRKDRYAVIITEIPYQVNKAQMIERIAALVREKKIEGVADIRDESNRHGIRVVIELRRDAAADVVLNQLYRHSQLQTSFGVNMLALNGGRPQQLSLREILRAFIDFREEVVTRRTKFDLAKARERAHLLVGLAIAVANIDEVVALIRRAPDPAAAREQLMARDWPAKDLAPLVALVADPRHAMSEDGTLRLSEEQAKAILDLRLQRLTALGRDEIGDELKGLAEKIADYLDILRRRDRVLTIIKDELKAVREEFATPRRTEIVEIEGEVEDEDLIAREEMVVTVTHSGYVKRTPLSAYRAQRRGGKGRAGMRPKDEDFVAQLFVGDTHTPLLFFTSTGMAYKMKLWRIPEGPPQARGKAFVNLLPLSQGERVTSILPLPEDEDSWRDLHVMFATRSGDVRRNQLSDFQRVNRNGKIAMKLEEGDAIVGVQICRPDEDVLLTTAAGMCIRFPVEDVRVFAGRTSTGVRGIRLGAGDHVISMAILRHVEASPEEARAYLRHAAAMRRAMGEGGEEETEDAAEAPVAISPERLAELGAAEQFVLTVTENGFGKRSSSYEYRTSGRGGKGIIAIVANKRNGRVVGSFPVEDSDQIMLVTDGGQLIRTPVNDIRVAGRNTQGVRIFRTREGEKVVSVERIEDIGDEDGGEGEG